MIRSLAGRRIVVPRAPAQASELADRLVALGATPVLVAVIAVVDPADGGDALREAARAARAGAYDWVVITSRNAADRWLDVYPAPWPLRPAIAAVGPGTAARLARVDFVPTRNLSEGLVADFADGPGRILLPRAAVARDVAPRGLRAKGWTVDIVEAYRTVPVRPDPARIAEALAADAIAFTSASTIVNFLAAAGPEAVPPIVVCIGPATAERAAAEGLRVDRVADPHTLDGLVAALLDVLGTPPRAD